MQQVLMFSVLYKTLPVIAAYDEINEDFELTTLRPWIFYEMRCFRDNPTSIVYVGHSNKGDRHKSGCPIFAMPVPQWFTFYEFGCRIGFNWAVTFVPSVFGVLFGGIGMDSIADFRYLMPAFTQVLKLAYEQMSRNDYLLTAAMISRVNENITSGVKVDFDRCSTDTLSMQNPAVPA